MLGNLLLKFLINQSGEGWDTFYEIWVRKMMVPLVLILGSGSNVNELYNFAYLYDRFEDFVGTFFALTK